MIGRAFAFAGLALMFGAWLTWVFFAAIMNLERVRAAGELTLPAKVFGAITLLVGAVLDMGLNVTLGTLLFLELQRELYLSARLRRLVNTAPNTWRGRFALWLRRSLLDNIDPSGVHDP